MGNIKLFENKQIRTVWNELEQKWYFSVQDVVAVLTDSADVKQYIKKILSRDDQLKANWGTICTPLKVEIAGGIQKMGCANAIFFLELSARKKQE